MARGMHAICLFFFALISYTMAARVTSPTKVPKNAVLLSKVKSLTVRAGQQTAARRVSSVPQLQCVGAASICMLYAVDVMRCTNEGSGYNSEDVEWSCKASLPEEFKLGGTDVSCEGYESSDDPYVLKGSCGVEYRLLLTEKGEEKFGQPDDAVWNISGKKSETVVSYIFWLIFLTVLAIILYNLYQAYRNDPRRQGGGRPGYGGGGGGGGPGDDPPPPYDPYDYSAPPKKPRTYTPRTNTGSRASSSRSAGGQQQGWRPGFWTGTAAGAAAGYLFNNRNQTRTQPEIQQRPTGGLFGGGGGGGGSSWTRQPSSGSSSSTPSFSSSRHESTGFGSTSRR